MPEKEKHIRRKEAKKRGKEVTFLSEGNVLLFCP
jgi:hypothetical protein